MADKDDTFDPNDLDSIDALLDEAELEASSDTPVDSESSTSEEPPVEAVEEVADSATDEQEAIMDSLDELVADAETSHSDNNIEQVNEQLAADPEPEVVGVSEPVAAKPEPTKQAKDNSEAADASDRNADEFLEKRAAAQAAQNSNLSVEEMDSIKKLIIIFGSVLSVLVITGIGIGVWSALAASSAGVDDETKELIASIKVSSERNGVAIMEGDEITKAMEKKLDGISFSLDQLMADLDEIGAKKKDEIIDPLGLGTGGQAKPATIAQPAPVVQTTKMVADEELMKKVSAMSSRLYRAQKSIEEANKRIKSLQSQSNSLMQSIKLVEKEALIVHEARQKKLEEMEARKNRSQGYPYSYSAGDGSTYDDSIKGSYP